MATPNKEQVYDVAISPLVDEILTICRKHGIACMLDFRIDTPEAPGLTSTSLIPDGTGFNHPIHVMFMKLSGMDKSIAEQEDKPEQAARRAAFEAKPGPQWPFQTGNKS